MTVSSTTNKSGPYNGNGSTSAFAASFKYTDVDDVEVIVTSAAGVETIKTLNTHYTLSAPGDSGTVTFITSPDYRPQTGETVTIRRTNALTQEYDPTTGGGITSAVIEATFDYVTFLIQQVHEKVLRAPKLRATTASAAPTFPEPSANALIAWNAAGDDLENKAVADIGSATFPVSSTDNAIARFDGTGGISLQNSNITISDAGIVAPTANGGGTLGTTALSWAGLCLAAGAALNWNAGDVTITHSANALAFAGATSGYSFDSTLSISPAAASTTKAISVAQTGPTSGTHGSTLDFNTIAIGSEQVSVSGTGTVYGLAVTHGFGGSNALGQRTAIRGLLVMNTATNAAQPLGNAYSAVSGEGQMSAADNGTDTAGGAKGTMIGLYGSSIAAAGAINLHRMAGAEINTAIRATASARYHVGAQITQWGDHAVSGAELDAGLQFGNQSGAVGWEDYGIVFDVSSAGLGTLFTANATIIGTKGAVTAAQGINFESATFTGAAFASNGFFVNGGGDVFGPSLTGGLNASSNLVIKSTGGVGTTDFIAFRVGNNGATEAARIVNAGQIIIGHTAAIAVNSEAGSAFTPQVEIHATGAGATESITRWSADANPGRFVMAKSRGAAIGTRGAVAASDVLGLILFNGDDGTNFLPGAYIRAVVDGTPGTNDLPTQLTFAVTADGAATPTEWMALRANGALNHAGGLTIQNGTAIPAGGTAGVGYKFSSTSNFGVFFGSGAPTLAAARGSLYLRSDGGADTLLYTNSDGGTTWLAVDNV